MATAYYRDQPGAPVLSYGSGTAKGFAALKQVLIACLVNGYGEIPAAGWELISEGEKHLVLRNGPRSGYVCFSQYGSYTVRIYLAQTYTGVENDVITGDGVKSGVATGNGTPQSIAAQYLATADAANTWMLVADERSFVLNMPGSSGSVVSLSSTFFSYGALLFVGEDDAGHFLSAGGAASASDTQHMAYFSSAAGFTVLTDPVTGLLVDTSALTVLTPALRNAGTSISTNETIFQRLDVAAIDWLGGGVYAGRLRGIVMAANMPAFYRGGVAKALGVPGDFTSRTASNPVDLGDDHSWFIAGAHDSYIPTLLLTTAPEYW